jgi:hypothetical protein
MTSAISLWHQSCPSSSAPRTFWQLTSSKALRRAILLDLGNAVYANQRSYEHMESSYFLDPHCITLVIVSHWLLCYTGYCVTLVIVSHWLLCYTGYCITLVIVLHWLLYHTGYYVTLAIVLHWLLCYTGYCITSKSPVSILHHCTAVRIH